MSYEVTFGPHRRNRAGQPQSRSFETFRQAASFAAGKFAVGYQNVAVWSPTNDLLWHSDTDGRTPLWAPPEELSP